MLCSAGRAVLLAACALAMGNWQARSRTCACWHANIPREHYSGLFRAGIGSSCRRAFNHELRIITKFFLKNFFFLIIRKNLDEKRNSSGGPKEQHQRICLSNVHA